jgi:endonuclease/exonuclease/phosphatase family metal-dependent hydrolase
MIRKWIFASVALAFIVVPTLGMSLENSIIPTLEHFEHIENLSKKKYSRHQYQEIKSLLDRKENRIRIVTYNMLFDLYDHNLEKVYRWPQRLPRIIELIEEMHPDILCVQELYANQLLDLMPYMENDFAWYAKPCKDGELNGIFYRKDRFEVIDSRVLYMTDTPEIPSSETLTQLQLKDLKTGLSIAVFNTHLAFSRIEKRDFQARFIAKYLNPIAKKMPVILTGDLNTFPHRLEIGNMPFYDGDYIHRILTQATLKDAREVAVLGHFGPISTFTNQEGEGIPFKGIGTPGVFLDHVYVSQDVQVLVHAVQPATAQGFFPSDHMPVLIDFAL